MLGVCLKTVPIRISHSFYFEKTTKLRINKLRVHINGISYNNITLRNSNRSIKIMFTLCESDCRFFYCYEKLKIFSLQRTIKTDLAVICLFI